MENAELEDCMTPAEAAVMRGLNARGFAYCIFTPKELDGVDPEKVNDAMAEAGWEMIDFWKE